MKHTILHIRDKKYVLALTPRAAVQIEEKCGDFRKLTDMLRGETVGETLDNTMWVLSVLMRAGKKYAEKEGIECDEPIQYDDLMDFYGMDDIGVITSAIIGAIRNGEKTTVDVEPPKN